MVRQAARTNTRRLAYVLYQMPMWLLSDGGQGIDMFSKGSGFGVLDEEPEEPCRHSAEILFNILLDVNDEG